eukprot:TRINITY_DN21740_c0_g1_i3.p2 TRINITY_DN21740_c0_g1~~TRINITY_DN21740_c0_g1_i3.p2  ORF type:complete len:118 (-),score=13.96 TRINITY_DN21740_c0_g1_i3:145-498(-)
MTVALTSWQLRADTEISTAVYEEASVEDVVVVAIDVVFVHRTRTLNAVEEVIPPKLKCGPVATLPCPKHPAGYDGRNEVTVTSSELPAKPRSVIATVQSALDVTMCPVPGGQIADVE